jgi:superfamily I DNA/RNA helicase
MVLARPGLVAPDAWTPAGVEGLEPNALVVVKSAENRSVIAGPGAGKTELLAQRAAFLLQTGACPSPRRILAISYKREAARNLSERVGRRCHRTHAARLDSQTFDAFAKSLVDRFGQTLPTHWRPTPDYEVLETTSKDLGAWLHHLAAPPAEIGSRAEVMQLKAKYFERDYILKKRLPAAGWTPASAGEWAASEFWKGALHGGKVSRLSFGMIGRLAALIVRTNETVQNALRLTYSHLFMDEFQDTTGVQYDLVKAIFLGDDVVLTAVGDNKQQIMRWAMAMPDPFKSFDADFAAIRTPLHNNYRSSPGLVKMQHILAQALDAKAAEPVAKSVSTISGEACEIWSFDSSKREAVELAAYVAGELAGGRQPREIAILVKQKADAVHARLAPAFAAASVRLRNEAAKIDKVPLQDLLPEELSKISIALLRLATAKRPATYWSSCLNTLLMLRAVGDDDDVAQAKVTRELDKFVTELIKQHPSPPADAYSAAPIFETIIKFLGRSRLQSLVPRYKQGSWLDDLLQAATMHLAVSGAGAASWEAALDAYEGLDSVPLMTIHKSKGLEYHTVIFVGLDDDAWWSFKEDAQETTAGFFVAFTRARQRVIFTHFEAHGRDLIEPLYALLAAAGVKTVKKV